jgi:hypothetical protein
MMDGNTTRIVTTTCQYQADARAMIVVWTQIEERERGQAGGNFKMGSLS